MKKKLVIAALLMCFATSPAYALKEYVLVAARTDVWAAKKTVILRGLAPFLNKSLDWDCIPNPKKYTHTPTSNTWWVACFNTEAFMRNGADKISQAKIDALKAKVGSVQGFQIVPSDNPKATLATNNLVRVDASPIGN